MYVRSGSSGNESSCGGTAESQGEKRRGEKREEKRAERDKRAQTTRSGGKTHTEPDRATAESVRTESGRQRNKKNHTERVEDTKRRGESVGAAVGGGSARRPGPGALRCGGMSQRPCGHRITLTTTQSEQETRYPTVIGLQYWRSGEKKGVFATVESMFCRTR